jgi:hypothetical protein
MLKTTDISAAVCGVLDTICLPCHQGWMSSKDVSDVIRDVFSPVTTVLLFVPVAIVVIMLDVTLVTVVVTIAIAVVLE